MTTAAFAAPRTRLRLTVRGRRVLAAAAALPVVGGLAIAALTGGGAALGSLSEGPSGDTFETVTVSSGDSLWSIAADVAPGHDPRDVVDAIVSLNQLPGGMLMPGDEIAIPSEYAAQ